MENTDREVKDDRKERGTTEQRIAIVTVVVIVVLVAIAIILTITEEVSGHHNAAVETAPVTATLD